MSDSQDKQGGARWHVPPFPVVTIGVSALIIAVVSLSQDFLAGLVAVTVLIVGLWGSYVLGQESRGKQPPVRQAYRHLATLHAHLYALTARLARDRHGLGGMNVEIDAQRARMALESAEFFVGQTLGVVADAMEDWAELAPREVEELRKELQAAPQVVAQIAPGHDVVGDDEFDIDQEDEEA